MTNLVDRMAACSPRGFEGASPSFKGAASPVEREEGVVNRGRTATGSSMSVIVAFHCVIQMD